MTLVLCPVREMRHFLMRDDAASVLTDSLPAMREAFVHLWDSLDETDADSRYALRWKAAVLALPAERIADISTPV